MTACPCGGIGRRVGLKIQSGLSLGASSSLAKGSYKKGSQKCGLYLFELTTLIKPDSGWVIIKMCVF